MAHLTIAAVGKLKEKYWQAAAAEYIKRLPLPYRPEIKEVREEPFAAALSAGEKQLILAKEGQKLLSLVPSAAYLIALDVHGVAVSSEEVAARLNKLLDAGQNIAFAIGGPLGIGAEVGKAARERWSLSKMTFTHQMARVILLEQIYRAYKINHGEKYHW